VQLAVLTDPDFTSSDVVIATDCDELEGVAAGLCYELGDWTQLSKLSPAQVVRMVTALLDRVAGAAGLGDADFELPLVGVSVQDLVAFNRKLNSFADTVEARDPQDLTALQEAIDAGLAGAGLPKGAVEAAVTPGGVFTLAVPLSFDETARYPFTFDVGLGDDPADAHLARGRWRPGRGVAAGQLHPGARHRPRRSRSTSRSTTASSSSSTRTTTRRSAGSSPPASPATSRSARSRPTSAAPSAARRRPPSACRALPRVRATG
jgi:hypothetical protein